MVSNRDARYFPKQKDTFQAFTTKNNAFGMGTVVWKSGASKKFKTLDY